MFSLLFKSSNPLLRFLQYFQLGPEGSVLGKAIVTVCKVAAKIGKG